MNRYRTHSYKSVCVCVGGGGGGGGGQLPPLFLRHCVGTPSLSVVHCFYAPCNHAEKSRIPCCVLASIICMILEKP